MTGRAIKIWTRLLEVVMRQVPCEIREQVLSNLLEKERAIGALLAASISSMPANSSGGRRRMRGILARRRRPPACWSRC